VYAGIKYFFTNYARMMATEGIDSSSATQYPLTLLVNVEIQEDRIEEFLSIMHQDALDSRTKEVYKK
jgi:hypothetical protein